MRALVLFGSSVVVLLLVLVFADPQDAPGPATDNHQVGHLTDSDG